MRSKRILPLLLLLLVGCSPELDFVLGSFEAPRAEVSGTSDSPKILFTSDEGQATVVFQCNRRWSAAFVNDRASEWCSLSGTEGRSGTVTVSVRVRQNEDYDQRSASIQFTCDDVTRTLVVTQKQKDALFLESNRIEMPSGGGSFTMTYRTNIDSQVAVSADAAGWIIPARTKGLSTHTESFTVKANETLESRQGTIEVTSALGKEVLTVYQAGEDPTLVLGAHQVEVAASGESFSVQVTSNLDVSVSIHDGKWLHEMSTKTISTNTYYFTADRNESRSSREDVLVFRDKKRGVADSVRVRQAFQPILTATDPWIVPGGTPVQVVLLTAGGEPSDFKVSSSSSWVFLSGIEAGEEGCRIVLGTRSNKGEQPRECKVSVYREAYSVPDEVTVSQVGKQLSFSYTTRRSEVAAPAFAQSGEGFILWGDGSFDYFDKLAGLDKGMVHVYDDGAKVHTIVVESYAIPWLLVPEPEDGMHFDFSTLKK